MCLARRRVICRITPSKGGEMAVTCAGNSATEQTLDQTTFVHSVLVLPVPYEWNAMCFNHKSRNASFSMQRRHSLILYERLEYIAAGKSGIVYGIDNERILKEYQESSEGDVERRAYERLGLHQNIARYLGSMEDGSIILERGQVLRTICQKASTDQIPLHRKLRWLRHAAEGLRHVHEKGIVQADVGCHNMILAENDCLKIIDFEGCSIDSEAAGSRYEWFSYRPSTPKVSRQTDIFAYGCAVYEIMTGRTPYHEFEKSNDPSSLVEQLYDKNQFPDVTNLMLGELMRSCWHGTFNSMGEVIQALEAASPLSLRARFGAAIIGFLKSSCCFK